MKALLIHKDGNLGFADVASDQRVYRMPVLEPRSYISIESVVECPDTRLMFIRTFHYCGPTKAYLIFEEV